MSQRNAMLAINEVSQRGAEVISQRDAVLTIQCGDADEMMLASCALAIMFVRIRTYAGDRFEAERCPGGAPWCFRSTSGTELCHIQWRRRAMYCTAFRVHRRSMRVLLGTMMEDVVLRLPRADQVTHWSTSSNNVRKLATARRKRRCGDILVAVHLCDNSATR